jgi:hypothetical protein
MLIEDIEWLKIIEHGYGIKSYEVKDVEMGVNTLDDYNFLVDKYHKSSPESSSSSTISNPSPESSSSYTP